MLAPGTVIAGKYRVERELGAGGMGAVYVAVNEVLQKRVALKVMASQFEAQPHAVERFFREAMSASRVRHPAIVEIYDAGRTDDGFPWMAMELLDGESLAERLARGPLALGEVIPIFSPILAALDAVHLQGIVHRDLKPDNIFLERLPDRSVQPKLLDFGIAKNADGIDKLTKTGAMMGTAHYLAPEQARDSSTVDPRTDLYACGVVLYEALSGRMPFSATTFPELIHKLVSQDPTPILSVMPTVPAALANVVHWCLARDVAARPQRATDLDHHLRRSLAGVPDVTAPAAKGTAAGQARTGSLGPGGAAALASVAAATRSAPPTSAPPVRPLAPTQHMSSSAGSTAPVGSSPTPAQPFASTPPMGGAGSTGGSSPTPAQYMGGTGSVASSPAPAFGAAPPLAQPRPRRGPDRLLLFIVGAVVLFGGCLLVGPIVLAIGASVFSVGVAARGAGGAGGGGSPFASPRFPRRWENWRMPFVVDVDGDGREDVVGWTSNTVGSDDHQQLCAFRGADGEVMWCADVGEQDDLSEEETALVGDRFVHFSARGQTSAFRVRDGESLGWDSSVRGEPEEVCALGADRLAVRTPDQLWSIVTTQDGRIALQGANQPPGCARARLSSPPLSLNLRVTSNTWREVPRRQRPRRIEGLVVRSAFASADRTLLIAVAHRQNRNPGMLALFEAGRERWRVVVPNDPLRAQAQVPEAVAITDEVAFVVYEMTGRGDAPRRMAAISLADGARRWDVGLTAARGNRAWYVVAGADLLAMSANQILLVLDRRTGEVRFQVGQTYER